MAFAQTGMFIDTEHGLSGSVVKNIYQDRNGIIWIASNSGLNLYNGYQIISFQRNGTKANSLASNLVNCVYQDRKGHTYVGSSAALQLYQDHQFRTVAMRTTPKGPATFYITSIFERRNGQLLVGTSGRGLWTMTSTTEAKPMGGALAKVNSVTAMAETHDGTLYLVCNEGGVYQLQGSRLRHFSSPRGGLSPQSVCVDRWGTIYVGCLDGGVWMKRHNDREFSLLSSTAALPITALCTLPTGQVLVGTDGQGARLYDPLTGTLSMPPFYSKDVDLSASKVSCLLSDRDGNIWLGLMQKGVLLQPTQHELFSCMGYKMGPGNLIGDKCVMALATAQQGSHWIATDNGGLFLLDRDNHLVRHFSCEGTSTLPQAILGMTEDDSRRLWVGSYQQGCGWVDQLTGTYHRLPCTEGNASAVFDVVADHQDNLWIGTMGDGLKRYNMKTGQVKSYRYDPHHPNSLCSNYINQLYLSADRRRLYVCHTEGLSCMDLRSGSWTRTLGTNCILKDITVYDVKEGPGQMIWIATPDGLYSYSLASHRQRRYSTAEGLTSNIVMALQIDRKGCVWLSTNNGINCLNPRTGKVDNYYKGDGLQGNEFSEGVSAADPSTGLFCFGGMDGITWFDPMKITQRRHPLHIMLTDFQVGGVSVTAGMRLSGRTITDEPTYQAKVFDLGHEDNSFTIYVSSLTYDNPERITYLYRINHEDWQSMPQGKNSMTFAHLDPGSYTIQVKARDNLSESEVREFTVNIHPAWYFSWWAKTIYLLLLVYLVYLYLRNLKRKQQNRLRLQEHIHAEQMSEAKLRFFINLSHDIRTPMTLILTPLLSLMKDDKDPGRQNIYALMKRNAERILHLVNQMMDLRKIDKGQMQLHCAQTDLVAFCRDVIDLFRIQARNRQITLSLQADADTLDVWIDRIQFDKVLMNLLSNAFKFTHTGGHISISISHDSMSARLSVADDGETIPEDKLDRIFERFYQGANSLRGQQTGTGVGLDLVRSIVDLHHGSIAARNTDDPKGCAFDITLPLGYAHLKPEERVTDEQQQQMERQLDLTQLNDPEDTPAEESHTRQGKGVNLPTIVVVDDEDELRHYLVQTLSEDYRVLECTNGKEALSTIIREIPDLVVSDVMMPEMDGFTLCNKIKTNTNINHIPVILLTAKGREEDQVEGMEIGADAYIPKPFNMDLLRSTIANLLQGRNLLRNKFTTLEKVAQEVDKIQLADHDEKLMSNILRVINANLSNVDFSVDMLAEEVGLSRVHLYRKMKELTNETPSDFIRNVRLKQAANLLGSAHRNISEVMYSCGFENITSFSRAFKKLYNMSPRQYMQEAEERKEKS